MPLKEDYYASGFLPPPPPAPPPSPFFDDDDIDDGLGQTEQKIPAEDRVPLNVHNFYLFSFLLILIPLSHWDI